MQSKIEFVVVCAVAGKVLVDAGKNFPKGVATLKAGKVQFALDLAFLQTTGVDLCQGKGTWMAQRTHEIDMTRVYACLVDDEFMVEGFSWVNEDEVPGMVGLPISL